MTNKRKHTTDKEDEATERKKHHFAEENAFENESESNGNDNGQMDIGDTESLSVSNSESSQLEVLKIYDSFRGKSYEPAEYKRSLHGAAYQLKLLLLSVIRGRANGHNFFIATEMSEAECFDDVVFIGEMVYVREDAEGNTVKNAEGKIPINFLQAKHSQNDNVTVTFCNLTTDSDDSKFALLKYFISYRLLKKKFPEDTYKLENFIVCTNINLNEEDIRKHGIILESCNSSFLSELSQSKLQINDIEKAKKLINQLEEGTDLHILATELKSRIKQKWKLTLRPYILSLYHIALVEEKVIEIDDQTKIKNKNKYTFKARFTENFKKENNLSANVKKLHALLHDIKEKEFYVCPQFGKSFEQIPDMSLEEAEIDEVVNLIKNQPSDLATYKGDEKTTKTFEKLAGHVFVYGKSEEFIKFSKKFLYETEDKLEISLKTLRSRLVHSVEKKKFENFVIEIQDYLTCFEDRKSLNKFKDENIKGDIKDFFNVFTFAKTDNEVDLSKNIKNELGNEFKLLDADFIADYLHNDIFNWMKEKGGKFLNDADIDKLYDRMRTKIEKLILAGPSIGYCRKLESYEMFFRSSDNVIETFLNSCERSILLLAAEYSTFLTTLKVRQALLEYKNGELYKKTDGMIFSSLTSLLRLKDKLICAFSSKKINHYLIIVVKDSDPPKSSDIFFSSIFNIATQFGAPKFLKKIIIIVSRKNNLNNMIKNNYVIMKNLQTQIDETKPDCLQEKSKKELYTRKLIFQEKQTLLETLMKNFINESIDMHTLFDSMMDVITVEKLITEKMLNIGGSLAEFSGYNDAFYITRNVMFLEIKNTVFNNINEKNILAVEGIKITDLTKYYKLNDNEIWNFDTIRCTNETRVIILNDFNAEKRYQKVCETYSKKNVHWLKKISDKLFWVKSKNNSDFLEPHKQNESEWSTEEGSFINYIKNDDSIVVLTDLAGMGKSTILTSLAFEMKEKDPCVWIVRINLNDYAEYLSEIMKFNYKSMTNFEIIFTKEEKCDYGQVIMESILGMLKPQNIKHQISISEPTFEQRLFMKYFEKTEMQKVVIMFDGYDEINPTYKDVVLEIISILKKEKKCKVWITTRPNFGEDLKKKFQAKFYTLEPYFREKTIDFLFKFWRYQFWYTNNCEEDYKKFKNDTADERIKLYAQTLVKKYEDIVGFQKNNLIAIPLQARILAEIFQNNDEKNRWDGCFEYIENTNSAIHLKLPEKPMTLYETLIRRKIKNYHHEEKHRRSSATVYEDFERYYNKQIKVHKALALHVLLKPKVTSLRFNLHENDIQNIIDKIKSGKQNVGIVTCGANDEIHFIHLTFAEYFALRYFNDEIASKDFHDFEGVLDCISHILKNASEMFIKGFYELLDERKNEFSKLLNGELLLNHVAKNKHSSFFKILITSFYYHYPQPVPGPDINGETPFDFAVLNQNQDALIYFVVKIYYTLFVKSSPYMNSAKRYTKAFLQLRKYIENNLYTAQTSHCSEDIATILNEIRGDGNVEDEENNDIIVERNLFKFNFEDEKIMYDRFIKCCDDESLVITKEAVKSFLKDLNIKLQPSII